MGVITVRMRSFLQGLYRLPHIKNCVSPSLSDNQVYPQFCIQACNDWAIINTFRQNPIYNQILEHVSEKQGCDYLKEIAKDRDIYNKMDLFKPNDQFGGPRMYDYQDVGLVSPTTLRYVKVLSDLKNLLGTLDELNISV